MSLPFNALPAGDGRDDPRLQPWSLKFGPRNPEGWRRSVWLTVSRTWFYAPSSLWWLIKDALWGILAGLATLTLGVFVWLVMMVWGTIAGLLGRASEFPVGKTDQSQREGGKE